MAIASRSCVQTQKFDFVQQIEKCSWQLRRPYESSDYYSEFTKCKWYLLIDSFDGHIKIGLRRCDYKKEYQSINVHLTIVDSFNTSPLYASKELDFTPFDNEKFVLCVTKEDLFGGYFGINKARFVPRDILTLKCEITAYETIEKKYANEDGLEDTKEYVKNKIYNWLLWVTIVVGSLIYICLEFVWPVIEPSLTVSQSSFIIMIVALCFFFYLIVVLILWVIKIAWNAVKPDGDRTYHGPPMYYS